MVFLSSTTVRNVGVIFDQDMSFTPIINKSQGLQFFFTSTTLQKSGSSCRKKVQTNKQIDLVLTFVKFNLDCCNSLSGYTENSLRSLHSIQNAVVHVLTRTGMRDHITPVLVFLHWLTCIIQNRK